MKLKLDESERARAEWEPCERHQMPCVPFFAYHYNVIGFDCPAGAHPMPAVAPNINAGHNSPGAAALPLNWAALARRNAPITTVRIRAGERPRD